jgi:hypothetical protein
VIHSQAQSTVTYDFNNCQTPVGTATFGVATVGDDGSGNNCVLHLTDVNQANAFASFSILNPAASKPVDRIHVHWRSLVGGDDGSVCGSTQFGRPGADGYSLSWATDLPADPSYGNPGEEGAGSGLIVAVDTFDNGCCEGEPAGIAPAIEIRWRGTVVAVDGINPDQGLAKDFLRKGQFVEADLTVNQSGLATFTYDGRTLSGTIPGWTGIVGGNFMFGARTGGACDNHWIDDLVIEAYASPHPFVSYAAPNGSAVRGDASLVIKVEDYVTQLNPASVKLSLDGVAVKPSLSKAGSVTTLQYQSPKLFPPGSAHTVELQFADNGNPAFQSSYSYSFTVGNYVGPSGNVYEVVLVPSHITWPQAKAAAEQRMFLGKRGHLATVTSWEEDVYLDGLRWASPPSGGQGQLWVGGYQAAGSAEPADGWVWLNNEGPIAGYNWGNPYANWQYGQPDNYWTWLGGSENYLAIGLYNSFGWNDDGFYGDGRYDGTLDGYIVEYEMIVPMDIRPGSYPNPVYLDAPGKLPVAILSTLEINGNTIDPSTVTFGRSGYEARPVSYSLSDVNGDKVKDLVCQFNIYDTGLMCGDTVGNLKATTFGGCPLRGSDSVQIMRCPPFALALQAMQDVNHLTDVYLTVSPLLPNCAAPTIAQSVQVKSFDVTGKMRWSRSAQNIALAPDQNTTVADLQYSDLSPSQKIKAQMEVKSCAANSPTVVLQQEGFVLLRPDLTVETISAPSSVFAGLYVNIFASIRELNGDLGASATVVLMEGDNILDWRTGVALNPFGFVDVFFATVFSTAGTHNLKVVVRDVKPGDYDASNNEKSFNLEVTEQPAYHYANYSHSDYENLSEWNYPYYYSGRNYQKGKSEYLNETLYLPVLLTFPINVSIEIAADGNPKVASSLQNLAADYSYDGGCYSSGSVSRQLGDGFYFNYYGYRDACWSPGYQYSYASLYKSAADYVYFSSYYYYYWGEVPPVESSGTVQSGQFLDAATSLDIRFVIGNATSTYGGTATMPIYTYPYDYSWNYEDAGSGYFDRGYNRGTNSNGYSSGYLTP